MNDILTRNYVKITGSGQKALMFAHGFGCSQQVWSEMVPSFSADYRVILFDYVGAGNSDLSSYDVARYGSLNGYANDIIDICTALQLQNVIFVGHSVSAMIGVLAAELRPDLFEKLIFLGPSPRYLNAEDYHGGFEKKDIDQLLEMMDSNYLGWSSAMGPAIMGNADRPELGERLTDNFCKTDPAIALNFARVTFLSDTRTHLPNVQVPSLTLQCREDIIAPLEVGYYINQHTPKNTLKILSATGHCSHLSAPAETVEAIKAFIED